MDWGFLLAPSFLVRNIDLIGQVISVMILVIFDEFVTGKVILPSVDKIRDFIFKKATEKISKKYAFVPKYFSEFLATAMFIFYFFMGYWILSEYAIVPILQRLQHILLLIVLIFFVTMSWLFNNKKIRKRYLYY